MCFQEKKMIKVHFIFIHVFLYISNDMYVIFVSELFHCCIKLFYSLYVYSAMIHAYCICRITCRSECVNEKAIFSFISRKYIRWNFFLFNFFLNLFWLFFLESDSVKKHHVCLSYIS